MENNLIYCRFCGEVQIPEKNFNTLEEGNEAAALCCTCEGAKAYQDEQDKKEKRQRNIDRINETINDLSDYCELRNNRLSQEVKDLLLSSTIFILDNFIDKITVQFNRIKTTISLNAKGNITIGMSYSDCTKTEI